MEQTALAGAEVEYADITSPSIDLYFALDDQPDCGVVIWTTTPGLPGNQAVAYNPEETYSLIEVKAVAEAALIQVGRKVYIASSLVEDFCQRTHISEHQVLATLPGTDFANRQAQHPAEDRLVPLLPGHHVTTEQGTGFVHTAPSHGPDDFEIGLKHDLNLACPVDGKGCYEDFVPQWAGQHIWKAQTAIIEDFADRGVLLQHSSIKHSYPVSWRSGKPLIFRTTKQWFMRIDHADLRKKALHTVQHDVKWHDTRIANQMQGLLENRGDWCLSRQRAWGVPLAFFINDATGEILNTPEVSARIAAAIEAEGVEVWQTLTAEQVGLTVDPSIKVTKVYDVVDVWFDSGVFHQYVLAEIQLCRIAQTYI